MTPCFSTRSFERLSASRWRLLTWPLLAETGEQQTKSHFRSQAHWYRYKRGFTASFRQPRKRNWATYKTELGARFTIRGSRIKSIARIKQTIQMITTNLTETFVESYPFNASKKGKTPWSDYVLAEQKRTTRILPNRALKSGSAVE